MNRTTIGDITEAKILARFIEKGYLVLKPWSNSCRYDLAIDDGQSMQRIQCKTGKLKNGSVYFHVVSIGNRSLLDGCGYHGDIDFFGVYCPPLGQCYLVPIDDVPIDAEHIVLRVSALTIRNSNQFRKYPILWAKDYEL